MTVNRRLLAWGVFFVAAGGVLLVAQGSGIGGDAVATALRYWPVLVIVLGVGLLLRHTRFDLAGTMLAAAVPGLLLGGVVAAAPRAVPAWSVDCSDVRPSTMATRDGTFAGAGTVELDLACGDVVVRTAPGSGWELRTGSTAGRTPSITADPGHLAVTSRALRHAGFGWPAGGDRWELTLPTGAQIDLVGDLSMGRGTIDLAGARLGRVDLTVNAAETSVNLEGATIDRLAVGLNAGSATVRLPADDFAAELRVNAGSLEVCVPEGLGLRVRSDATLADLTLDGFVRTATGWETPGYGAASHTADVTVAANVGSVDITLEGGCQ